ncbi:MAG: hypothetical protein AYK23_04730 [Candidatus Proteinoplasmatales archaeon SG8-5]|nr:MAG: hypothetical protein AYK23_04730 [Candidatus Proteinoplasmatales archaeon SG8-5]
MGFFDFLDPFQNPWSYMLLLFIYCVLAAVILPIPVELGLAGFISYLVEGNSFLGLPIFLAFLLLALIMGAGKCVGSWVVFHIGVKVEDTMRRFLKWNWFQKLTEALSRFCERFGYIATYIVLSIPIMPDTVPLYIFSLLNRDGEVFETRWFVLTNFWAGTSRALVVGILVLGGLWSFA